MSSRKSKDSPLSGAPGFMIVLSVGTMRFTQFSVKTECLLITGVYTN
jgi:hypothetical protein